MRVPKFNLRPARTNTIYSVLVFKIYFDNQCLSKSTGISVPIKHWKQEQQRIHDRCRNSIELNLKIKEYIRTVDFDRH